MNVELRELIPVYVLTKYNCIKKLNFVTVS